MVGGAGQRDAFDLRRRHQPRDVLCLGAVHDDLNGTLHGSSTVFGWQALGGLEYAMAPKTSLFAEYRYQNAHDANIGVTGPIGNTSNNVSMGVKFAF